MPRGMNTDIYDDKGVCDSAVIWHGRSKLTCDLCVALRQLAGALNDSTLLTLLRFLQNTGWPLTGP